MDSNLEWLQSWYTKQCNGDWEHTRGITLNTLDNPGWTLTVDLDQTPWASYRVERRFLERTEQNWVHWKIADKQFRAEGGPGNLTELLAIFRLWIETTPPITNQ